MRVVGIKELKNRLSEYVRIAAAGERVLVTDRDRVVAELTAPSYGTPEFSNDVVLADAVRKGWLRPPTYPQQERPPRVGGMRFDDVMEGLDADREDRSE